MSESSPEEKPETKNTYRTEQVNVVDTVKVNKEKQTISIDLGSAVMELDKETGYAFLVKFASDYTELYGG